MQKQKQSGQGYPSQTPQNHNNVIVLGDHNSGKPPAPPPRKYTITCFAQKHSPFNWWPTSLKASPFNWWHTCLKAFPFQLVAQQQNPKPNPQLTRSGCNTKVELQKGSGCNTKVELQKRSGCNTKGSGCNTKVELQKGSGCNTKVELQKGSLCNTKGSGCNTKVELQKGSGCKTKVELQKGSGCNTKVELGPKTLHCLDVPKVHPPLFWRLHCSGGGGPLLIKCQHYNMRMLQE